MPTPADVMSFWGHPTCAACCEVAVNCAQLPSQWSGCKHAETGPAAQPAFRPQAFSSLLLLGWQKCLWRVLSSLSLASFDNAAWALLLLYFSFILWCCRALGSFAERWLSSNHSPIKAVSEITLTLLGRLLNLQPFLDAW